LFPPASAFAKSSWRAFGRTGIVGTQHVVQLASPYHNIGDPEIPRRPIARFDFLDRDRDRLVTDICERRNVLDDRTGRAPRSSRVTSTEESGPYSAAFCGSVENQPPPFS